MLILIKIITALFNCLLFLSIYLFAAKFFGKKIGILASILLLFCFPLYELNFFGGYPIVISIAFMLLLSLYLIPTKNSATHSFLAFTFAFSLVLSHQLTAFIAFIVLSPIFIFVLATLKGHYLKAWIFLILGGLAAFFIYYLQGILPYIDILIGHVFFQIKTNVYQIPSVSANALLIEFWIYLSFCCTRFILSIY